MIVVVGISTRSVAFATGLLVVGTASKEIHIDCGVVYELEA